MNNMKQESEKGLELNEVSFVDMSDYFGKPRGDYLATLGQQIDEAKRRATGRVIHLAAEDSSGIPEGVIEELEGRLYFPVRGQGIETSVPGIVLEHNFGSYYVTAEVFLRAQGSIFGISRKVLLFHDGSALLPCGDGRGQMIDVLATYEKD